MAELNDTPNASRLHIGVFGRTNSGKSSLINKLTGQSVSIVSDISGTTTDLVYKAMEFHPLGPCVFIDTAGFDDESELAVKRIEKTKLAGEKTDIAIMVISAENNSFAENCQELTWYEYFKKKNIPVIFIINKSDLSLENAKMLSAKIEEFTKEKPLIISCINDNDTTEIKNALIRKIPQDYDTAFITGNLVNEDDVIMLVMPQDIQAPKGRLILPQVQTIRELLDRKCITICVTADKIKQGLSSLVKPPKLIITDSQVFPLVYETKPKESMLTSFSVLFAAYKGDLTYYIEGAKAIDTLTENSRVLIAECCTHAPLAEDIGRVKIPNMLRKRFGQKLIIEHVSGTDFPKDLAKYDLIIQCGGCMFNRRYILSRIDRAKQQKIPMTNYGVTIAHITGILEYKTT
ncbi:MAG: [FeFe] hydrogenase H-cluster maturation GTPase HydF [Selenomonadaceae bacterium]|nr:[FeFe] hydrogenase H-cluster maturation GTPase HydF [Selenomonadaceae bacterium]